MRTFLRKMLTLTVASLVVLLTSFPAQAKDETPATKPEAAKPDAAKAEEFKPEQQASKGSVTVGGNVINYDAFAGTVVVHPKDWDDVP